MSSRPSSKKTEHQEDETKISSPSSGLPNQERRLLTEDECPDKLGFAFSTRKKWWILTVIFLVQTSMNFNTTLYSNGLKGISEQFDVSEQAARVGAAIFLVAYAFGCELWAPWSEEMGRKPVMQMSLFLVNLFALPVGFAPNFASILIGRFFGGLASAGGSVTLGMIADMFDADNQQFAVAYIVFSSVGGSILGPIIGGFIEQYLPWQWTIWVQLMFGAFVQLLHLFTVPETRSSIMVNKEAKRRRLSGEDPNVYGPDELEPLWQRLTWIEIYHTWMRPFKMFVTEPIVGVLSLLSGFADALIFMMVQSFALVYKQWDFDAVQIGLSFIPIGIGYVIAWLLFIPAIRRNMKRREARPYEEYAQYESRLELLLYLAPCLPIGLLIFAWTSSGPPLHWIGTMVASCIIGIANYAIYMATIDYMVCAYGPYSASATGGNGWARDFLAGVLTVPATPFYQNVGAEKGMNLEYASMILFCISFILVGAVYAIYHWGPKLRERSPFAQSLAAAANDATGAADIAGAPDAALPDVTGANDSQHLGVPVGSHIHRETSRRFGPGSRKSSYVAAQKAALRSREASRRQSYDGSHDASQQQQQQAHQVPPEALLERLTTIASTKDTSV